jgi:hypothetical protein
LTVAKLSFWFASIGEKIAQLLVLLTFVEMSYGGEDPEHETVVAYAAPCAAKSTAQAADACASVLRNMISPWFQMNEYCTNEASNVRAREVNSHVYRDLILETIG